MKLLISCLLALAVFQVGAVQNILQFGAIPDSKTTEHAFANAEALRQALLQANATEDKEVLVPSGAVFTMMPMNVSDIHFVTLTVDGTVHLSDDNFRWPNLTKKATDFWSFSDSTNLHFRGSGEIDGRGYMWWWREILVMNNGRPHMIRMMRLQNVTFEGIRLVNSPQFHILATDIDSFVFQDFEIYVDIWSQQKLLAEHGHFNFHLKIPTFPLNTDGIDPSGTNVHIRNVTITNFDDAVAVKPGDKRGKIAQCAQNMLIEDCKVTYSVGMTIGSVPPNTNYNCVKDIVFRNIEMYYPIKAIYVKTNPGENGYGIISNITYENFKIYKPLWWGIYIGPQQQKQPDGGGPGCMFYPLNLDCATQPRVTVENILLKNISVKGSVLTPGIVRCHPENPCKNIRFENVIHDAWYNKLGLGFIVENVEGEVINSHPHPKFNKTRTATPE